MKALQLSHSQSATKCELLDYVYTWQMGNLRGMQKGLNNTGFQRYPVKYLHFKAFWHSLPLPKKGILVWSEQYMPKSVSIHLTID